MNNLSSKDIETLWRKYETDKNILAVTNKIRELKNHNNVFAEKRYEEYVEKSINKNYSDLLKT